MARSVLVCVSQATSPSAASLHLLSMRTKHRVSPNESSAYTRQPMCARCAIWKRSSEDDSGRPATDNRSAVWGAGCVISTTTHPQ